MATKIPLLIHAFSSLLSVPCWEENSIRAGMCVSNLPRTPRTPRGAQLGNAAAHILPSLNKPRSPIVETSKHPSSKDFPFALHVERAGSSCFYRCGNQGPDHVGNGGAMVFPEAVRNPEGEYWRFSLMASASLGLLSWLADLLQLGNKRARCPAQPLPSPAPALLFLISSRPGFC